MERLKLSDNTIAIYTKVEKALVDDITFSNKSLSKNIVKVIYKKFGKYIKKRLNYDLFATGFNQAFFYKNLLKCLVVTEYFVFNGPASCDVILDAGSGAAPASIAYSELRKRIAPGCGAVNVRLVDKSQKQLLIAKRLLAHLDIPVQSCINDSFRIDDVAPNEIVVFSYFICEQGRSFATKLFKNRERFKGGFLIIDYQYVIERVKKAFSQFGKMQVQFLSAQIEIPENLRKTFGEDRLVVHGCYFKG